MRLKISHHTHYDYTPAVDHADHLAHLQPIDSDVQQVKSSALCITPEPSYRRNEPDSFGNPSTFFSLQSRHDSLDIIATSEVITRPGQALNAQLDFIVPWESQRDQFRFRKHSNWHPASAFLFASPYVPLHQDFLDYAVTSFTPKRPLFEATHDLMSRIHHEFEYASDATDINTPARQALAQRRGVCQDFAHIMLACLRGLGLATRYVSGYLLTTPPEGQPRLIGCDASHAWISVFLPYQDQSQVTAQDTAGLNGVPQGSWIDFDPTNHRWGVESPGEDYVRLALGRDYSDVSPLRGVIHGGAHHTLNVAVTVSPVEYVSENLRDLP